MRVQDAFAIVVCHDSNKPVVRVTGEIDVTNAPAFSDALGALAAVGERDVDLDLSSVNFIDSNGIRALLQGQKSGLALRVVASSEQVDRVLQMACLEPVLHSGVDRKL